MNERVTLMGREFNTVYLNAHQGMKKAMETGEFEGIPFRLLGRPLQEGDTYLAERNSEVGLVLLTCRKNDVENRWVEPVESAYFYNTGECIGIELLFN
jgi:hypothetical protein